MGDLGEDWYEEVLSDSFDMDWTARDGARAIIRALERRDAERRASRRCGICDARGDADHAPSCSESW